jgi:hypothetical protein
MVPAPTWAPVFKVNGGEADVVNMAEAQQYRGLRPELPARHDHRYRDKISQEH